MAEERDLVFCIADLSGYTALTEAHGSREAAKIVARYVELAETTLSPAVRLVERVGDELLIVAPDPAVAVEAAICLRAAVEYEPLFPAVRAGLHAGPVLEQGGRYFGAPINLTARVAAHARAGQIVCTSAIAEAAEGLAGVIYRPLGQARFKNVTHPVALFEVLVGRAVVEVAFVDPVCRMQVRPEEAAGQLAHAGRAHYFCSLDCMRAFAGNPEAYASGTGDHAP